MFINLANLKSRLRLRLAVSIALCRSLLRWHPLPPGDMIDLFAAEHSDRELLLKLTAIHGPIFKALYEGDVLVCVVGLPIGRRLLKEHASALQPVAPKLGALFPKGFMRQMEDDCHRLYRAALMRGLNGLESNDHQHDLEIITSAALCSYESGLSTGQGSTHDYLNTMSVIASSMLLRIFFGAEPGSRLLKRLLEIYNQLGPHGFVWRITEAQIKAYGELRDELRNLCETEVITAGPSFASSLFGRLSAQETVDDTLMGNLIYMVEMGRYDLRCLFRWISKYSTENPNWMERISTTEKRNPEQAQALAKAFVLETLRMDQSERLMRNVKQDIVFDGYTIPKNATVRICLWEAHKNEVAFPDPFAFVPERFLNSGGPSGDFSPFGLDHHHCPFSTMSIELCTVFLRTLAKRYRVKALENGPAVRGNFHWEPAKGFSVELRPRDNAGLLVEAN